MEGTITIDALEMVADAYRLHPNQYVQCDKINYKFDGELTEKQKFDALREYIKKNYLYDYIKASTVKKGALPDIVQCFKTKRGIC